MRRTLFGIALLLHGLAHANAGMLAADGPRVLPAVLWAIASISFMAAGFGLLGVRRLDRYWQWLGLTAIASSLLMLAVYRPATAVAGIAIDIAFLGVIGFISIPRLDPTMRHTGRRSAVARIAAFAFLSYATVAILSRPWHSR